MALGLLFVKEFAPKAPAVSPHRAPGGRQFNLTAMSRYAGVAGAFALTSWLKIVATTACLLLLTVAGCARTQSDPVTRICAQGGRSAIEGDALDLGVIRILAPKGYNARKSRGWHGEVVIGGPEGEVAFSQGHWGPGSFRETDTPELPMPVCDLRIDGMPVHVFAMADVPDNVFARHVLAHIDFPAEGMQVLMHAEIIPGDEARIELFRQLLWDLRKGDPDQLLRAPGDAPERRLVPN